MPNFPVHSVDGQYRSFAKLFVVLGLLAIAIHVAYGAVIAVLGALQMGTHAAPTTNRLVNGAVNNKWGRMPYLVLDARGANITEIAFIPEDTYYKQYGDNFKKVRKGGPNFTVRSFGTALVLNLTAYTPDFDHIINGSLNHFHSTLLPQFLLCWNVSCNTSCNDCSSFTGLVDVLSAPTATPHHMFGEDVPHSEQWFVHQSVVGPGFYQWGTLAKAIVPNGAPYWGLPGEALPTIQQTIITTGATMPSKNAPVSCLHMVVGQSSVSVTEPISVASQIMQSFSSAGGSMALASSLFLLLFVKKHPHTSETLKDQELTFRGFKFPSKSPVVAADDGYAVLGSLPEPLLKSEDSDLETP